MDARTYILILTPWAPVRVKKQNKHIYILHMYGLEKQVYIPLIVICIGHQSHRQQGSSKLQQRYYTSASKVKFLNFYWIYIKEWRNIVKPESKSQRQIPKSQI